MPEAPRPGPPPALVQELVELINAGRWDQLELKAGALVALHPGHAVGWRALAKALVSQRRLPEALDVLARIAKLTPLDAEAHFRLGEVLGDLGRLEEAEASYRRALELDPRLGKVHVNLGSTLMALGRLEDAQASYRRALALDPGSYDALLWLGCLLGLGIVPGQQEEAATCLERAIALCPQEVDAHWELGNLLLRMGQADRALPSFRRAQALRPLITFPALREKADFAVLFLDSPGAGSTPISYLAGGAPYDSHFFWVLPGPPPDTDLLKGRAQVVFNMVADADRGWAMLPSLQNVVDLLGLPTVNPPCRILETDRETIARRLADLPLCRIPGTVRLTGADLAAEIAKGGVRGLALPLLVRLAGTHGGDDFEKFDDLAALLAYTSGRPEESYYLAEYLDYRSSDGFFRKYRWICLDGELLPYHLAIHDAWKVHHFRTDMANQAWMRQEEARFLEDPSQVFDEPRQAALRAVAAATGLDYCGIDCALDFQGRIIVFETNAAMLVHDEKRTLFAYKNPYIAKIKTAFDAMLRRRAQGVTPPSP